MANLAGGGRPLPEDLVFCEILTRLPAKPLLRCRAVCRSWCRRLTSDAMFLLAHHRRQPSLQLVTIGDWTKDEGRIYALDLRSGDLRPVARTTDRSFGAPLKVLASCDGLLILHANDRLQICNPATRQRAPLTLLHGAAGISALYHHRPSGSYRVLSFFNRMEDDHAVYYVHTLGSRELRCVGEPPAPPWASGDLVTAMMTIASFSPPVLADGRIYWGPVELPGGNGNGNNMLVFDTMAESFQHLLSPVQGDSFEMSNGALGLYRNHGGTIHLWKLQDHKSSTWSLNNQIKLPANAVSGMTVLEAEGDVLLLSLRGGSSFRPKHLQHISGANGSLLAQYYVWGDANLCLQRHRFRESLVRHDFFSMEGNARGVDEKPLFDGLSTAALLRHDTIRWFSIFAPQQDGVTPDDPQLSSNENTAD